MAVERARIEQEIGRRLSQRVEIRPAGYWYDLDLKSVWRYRELLLFLVWRDIKGRYAQSVLGIGWAILQPLFSVLVFTIVLGRLANIGSDGVPYALFSYSGLVVWHYFSGALSGSTESLVSNASLITKIYFPRVITPLAPILGKLVDFAISFAILLFIFLPLFGGAPNWGFLYLPLLVLLTMVTAAGLGMVLAAVAVQYRDVRHAMGFLVQLGMYAAPVVYPASLIPEWVMPWYALNPLVGVIEGFRSALLGTRPMPWDLIGPGALVAVVVFIVGLLFFRHKERLFADVV